MNFLFKHLLKIAAPLLALPLMSAFTPTYEIGSNPNIGMFQFENEDLVFYTNNYFFHENWTYSYKYSRTYDNFATYGEYINENNFDLNYKVGFEVEPDTLCVVPTGEYYLYDEDFEPINKKLLCAAGEYSHWFGQVEEDIYFPDGEAFPLDIRWKNNELFFSLENADLSNVKYIKIHAQVNWDPPTANYYKYGLDEYASSQSEFIIIFAL